MLDPSYPCFAVSLFSCSFLSTSWPIFGHVWSRGYLSTPILFPRIGYRYSNPMFALASLSTFFSISCREIPGDGTISNVLYVSRIQLRFFFLPMRFRSILLSVFCGFSVFMLHSYRPLGRSLGMSYLAVTFPCRSFFHGSGLHSIPIFAPASGKPRQWGYFECSLDKLVSPSLIIDWCVFDQWI